MLTIYATKLSANGRKVLAVARHLAVPAKIVTVNVYAGEGRTEEYLAIHPLGKIPALVDSDFTLWESNAILLYLAEAYGGGRLWSNSVKGRADIARWMFWESSEWQPALSGVLASFATQRLFPNPTAPAVEVDWSDARFRRMARFLDDQLRGRAHLVDDALTLADFSVAAMLMYVKDARFPSDDFPNIAAWYAGIDRLDAWKTTAEAPWE